MTYRVFHTGAAKTIAISGIADVYPEGSLYAEVSGTSVTIKTEGDTLRVVGPVLFNRFSREDGTGFMDATECKTYLDVVFDTQYVDAAGTLIVDLPPLP